MKIALFGATGTSGKAILAEALDRGHEVVALVRDPAKLRVQNPNLELVTGDVLDPVAVERTVKGTDAAVVALGAGMRRTTLRADGTRSVVQAMKRFDVRRLVVQSIFGLDDGHSKLPWHWRVVVKPIILRNAYRDHEHQEAVVAASGLDWIITRPVSLRDTESGGQYQAGPEAAMDTITCKIGITDLARFTLDQLDRDTYLGRRPGISY